MAAGSDPLIQRFRTSIPRSAEAADRWLERTNAQFDEGERLEAAIVNRETATVIGSISLESFEQRNAMTSFWLLPAARGAGVMTGITSALSAWAFDELELARLAAFVEPENEASRSVLERAGFTLEGHLRSHWDMPDGRRVDSLLFARLVGDS